jgi:hypothetical protein
MRTMFDIPDKFPRTTLRTPELGGEDRNISRGEVRVPVPFISQAGEPERRIVCAVAGGGGFAMAIRSTEQADDSPEVLRCTPTIHSKSSPSVPRAA